MHSPNRALVELASISPVQSLCCPGRSCKEFCFIADAWFNSTCYHPPPGTPPGICVLDVLFPTPGHTERDNFPPPGLMTWTKNKLLRFDDLFFFYLNKTRNPKNPKLLEQLAPFRSKANIIKLDTHSNDQEGVSTKLPRKLKCISTKQHLNS